MEDQREDWYERLVEHLLADPRHGERWGRHWMDIWRYSDGWGLGAQHRNSQKHMWHFRDWLVESLNADIPYDTMVRLMLSADEIAPTDISALRATGFLARNWFLFNRNSWMEETVEHVGKGLLGLTMNCTKCHDHKYDPFAQNDFYRMRAVFEPYHVRMDILPGEVDVEKNGIPRVFDGRQDVPTYRFERGEESKPDKSRAIEPGAPLFFGKDALRIHPVPLPPEATEPERQPWVLEAHLTAAASALERAQNAVSREEKALEKAGAAEEAAPGEKTRAAREDAESALHLSRLALRVSESELESVRRRTDAIRAAWNPADPGALDAARRGVPAAERELNLAQAAHTVALKQAALRKATPEKKNAAEKELKTAETALQKARTAAPAETGPPATFRPLPGAKWVPTRFLSSGKDDPEVPFPKTSSGRRKAFAEWVSDPQNPLPARVAANHLWGRHFGFYIAATPFDLGRAGSPPTHPELLDWLAAELVEHGWSLKHIHRILVTSATYRMSSSTRGRETELSKDPDNTRIWRRLPVRLEAEAIRDALLTLSGEIDWSRGGPPIPANAQANSKRRSLYFYHSNNERNLFLTTFDGPMVRECYRREQSIVPQQALALINGALSAEASKKIATLVFVPLSKSGTPSSVEFVKAAFRHVLGMQPTPAEAEASVLALEAWKTASTGPDPETAARAQLVWVLLNHNDFITLR
jgi:hypothetical protein